MIRVSIAPYYGQMIFTNFKSRKKDGILRFTSSFYWLPSIKMTSSGRDRFGLCKLSGTKEAATCVDREVLGSGIPLFAQLSVSSLQCTMGNLRKYWQ